ncbi:MAG: hypothetical protein KAS16_07960 [Thermoplasmata archaeon]|nr:hypothetical protein [Thermoplasmata archaeon]
MKRKLSSPEVPKKTETIKDTGRRYSVKAVFALIFYLVMPIMVLLNIIKTYPELSEERYMMMIWTIIPFALLMVVISQLSIRYPRGDKRRLWLNYAYVTTAMLWLFAFLGGGVVITQNWGVYEFSLHLEKYVLLILAITLFNCLYYFLEWWVYSDEDDDATGQVGNAERWYRTLVIE